MSNRTLIYDEEVKLMATVYVNEEELRALNAIASCGMDVLIKFYADNYGKDFIRTYKNGLREFFESIRRDTPTVIRKIDAAREAFKDEA